MIIIWRKEAIKNKEKQDFRIAKIKDTVRDTINQSRYLLDQYDSDEHKEDRQRNHLCKYCMYLDYQIVMHAMTEFECMNCRKKQMHENSSVPMLCKDCAEQYAVCEQCGNIK